MTLAKFTKDPDAVLDYTIDWSAWLAHDDFITSATSTPDAGITVDSTDFTVNSTTTWVSGGTTPTADVVVHIITDGGREDDRTLSFVLKDL